MRCLWYGLLGSLCAILSVFIMPGGAHATHTRAVVDVRLLPVRGLDGHLVPGMRFTAIVQGLGSTSRAYCLGLTSMQDRYGIPVTLGALRRGDGALLVRTRVPMGVFPAEPPGPFLLFVGHCTDVAPEGIFGSTIITILPAGSGRRSPAALAAERA